MTSEKVDAGGGSYLLEKSYAYDAAGHPISETNADGSVTYSYDDVYNLTGVTDRQSQTYSYTYDGEGKLQSASTAGKNLTFIYNTRGMLEQSTDAGGVGESFIYDDAGNLASRTDSAGGQVFTTSYVHTPRNQVKEVNGPHGLSTYAYDAAGRLSQKNYSDGISTTYAYDAAGRLTLQESIKGGQTVQSFAQSFDPAGNLTQVTEAGLGALTYEYDPLNRLTSETIPSYGNISYGYDRTGNRTSYFGPERYGNYAYNAANQLTEAYENEQQLLYSYDAAGSLTRKADPANTTTYTYDGLGRMSRATTPTDTVDYSYDALGRKDSRTHQGNTIYNHFLAKTDLIDYKTDSSGVLNTEVVRGPDGMVNYTVHTGQGPVTAFEHFSPHGDTVLVTSENGDTRAIARYDSFGNALTGGGLANGYTGKWQREKDGRTGLIDMGVRDYDPAQGRFMGPDPLKGNGANPQDRNRYPYAFNNPLRYLDLDGMEEESFWDHLNPFDDDEEGENSSEDGADPNSLIPTGDEFVQAIDDPMSQPEGIVGAGFDLAQGQMEMLINNDKGHSLYYHCKANYEATNRGYSGRQTSRILSWLKEEAYDDLKHRNDSEVERESHLKDKERDYRVNERARNSCMEGQGLEEACPYIPDNEFQMLVGV
jgi:RHS repeat-associated protein